MAESHSCRDDGLVGAASAAMASAAAERQAESRTSKRRWVDAEYSLEEVEGWEMAWVLVRHQVADYDRWRPVFDGPGTILRGDGGCRGGHVFRTPDDPNDIVVLLEWDSPETLRQFMASPELKEAMQASGVIGEPQILFLDELPRPNVGVRRERRAA